MAPHEVLEENLSHDEIQYRYYIQRGVDFIKIELFRSAREHYKQALNYKPGDPFALERIDACNEQIRKDRTKVLILVPLVLALIAVVIAMNV
jgi:tetratricopeptide (TPR) repeat protein